jgi:hypothetical protein
MASPRFKSGDLNTLHLDRAALSLVFHEEENENAALSLKKSSQKHRMKNEKKNHHHHRNVGNKYNNEQHKLKCSHHTHKSAMQQTIAAPCPPTMDDPHASAQPKTPLSDSTPTKVSVSMKAPAKQKVSNVRHHACSVLNGIEHGKSFTSNATESVRFNATGTNWPRQSQG